MPNVTVELDWETVDNIVLSQLQDAYSGLVTDLEERQNESRRGGIFDTDKDTDIILIKKYSYISVMLDNDDAGIAAMK